MNDPNDKETTALNKILVKRTISLKISINKFKAEDLEGVINLTWKLTKNVSYNWFQLKITIISKITLKRPNLLLH